MSARKRHAYAAPAWAQEQRLGGVALKATLMVLANYADEKFSCYPTVGLIAEETEQSTRTVIRHLALFGELGLIGTTRRFDPATGARTSNRYHLQLDVTVGLDQVRAARARLKARDQAPGDPQDGDEGGEIAQGLSDTVSVALGDTVSGALGDTVSGALGDTVSVALSDTAVSPKPLVGGGGGYHHHQTDPSPERVRALFDVVQHSLPMHLGRGLRPVPRLLAAIAAAAGRGWDEGSLSRAVRAHDWANARGGAVVALVEELGAPPEPAQAVTALRPCPTCGLPLPTDGACGPCANARRMPQGTLRGLRDRHAH